MGVLLTQILKRKFLTRLSARIIDLLVSTAGSKINRGCVTEREENFFLTSSFPFCYKVRHGFDLAILSC